MAEKQTLFDLDINTDAVVAKSVDLKNKMTALRSSIEDLKKAEGDQTEALVRQEAALKKVSSEYTMNQKVLQNVVNTTGKTIPIQERVNALLNEEITTVGRAKTSITEMSKLRDTLNVKNTDEAKLMKQLNDQIDANTDFQRENGTERERNILNVGNYTESVKTALKDTGLWSGEIEQLTQVTSALSLPFKELNEDFKNAFSSITEGASAIKGLVIEEGLAAEGADLLGTATEGAAEETTALTVTQRLFTAAMNIATGATRIFTLALAATGIGLIISAVALLLLYLRTFAPVMDKVEQIFSAFGAVVEVVQRAIFDFVAGLSDLRGSLEKVGKFFSNPIKAMKEFGKEMKAAANDAMDLVKAQQDLEDASRLQEISNAKATQQVKELMLQSKNRALTEQQRLDLLKKANDVEAVNFKQRQDLAEGEIDLARRALTTKAGITAQDIARLKEEGTAYALALQDRFNITDEEIDNLQKAEIAKIKILEESTAIKEKIQNQSDALEEKRVAENEKRIKAAADYQKKIQEQRQKLLDDAVTTAKVELDFFMSNQGIKAKSLQEEVELAEKIKDQKLNIAQKEFEASKKTEEDKLILLTKQNDIRNEYLQKQVDSAVKVASKELDAFIQMNTSKIDQQKFFTELSLQEEQRRLDLLAEANLEFQDLQLEKGIINEQTYFENIDKIQEENRIKKEEAQAARDLAESERKAIDLENQLAIDEEIFQNNLDVQLQRLELRRENELKVAEKTGADKELINKKYQVAKEALERQAQINELSMAQQTIGEIGALMKGFFGENKLLAGTLAAVDAILGAQKAFTSQLIPTDPTSLPRAIFAAAKAGAFGALNVAKIAGIKLAKGGQVWGAGSGTSDSIPAMLSNGESVINARSSAMFGPLLSAINVLGGGDAFSRAGLTYPSDVLTNFGSNQGAAIDYEKLANMIGAKVGEANRNLPSAKIVLEEFEGARSEYLDNKNAANF